MRQPQTNDDRALLERLEEFNQRGEQVDLEKIELSLPFQERIIFPMARKLGDIAVKFTPQNAMRSISRNLELAGNPARLDPTIFLALQFIISVVLLVVLIPGVHRRPIRLARRSETAHGGSAAR